MPSDDYAVIGGGGALKLKGAKVSKKKKKRDKTDLEKNVAGDSALVKKTKSPEVEDDKREEDREEEPLVPAIKTESERRYEEVRKKRVSPESPLCHVQRLADKCCSLSKWPRPPAPGPNY